jgi:hypothetical protein
MEAPEDCASREGKCHFKLCALQRILSANQTLWSLSELNAMPSALCAMLLNQGQLFYGCPRFL